jgi:hypothetical protein
MRLFDLVLQQLVAFAERDAALEVQHDDVADSPLLDLHGKTLQ